LDHEKCLSAAKEEGWNITQILNTHEHHDHTGGNSAMVRKTGATILAHKNARDKIADIARGLSAGMSSKWARRSSLRRWTRRAIP
jgi:hydroxyacylglutathione hydrolase